MEIETITASYTHKINHALYGGGQYESSDHFVSLSACLETGEDPIQAEKELRQLAQAMVTKGIEDEITSFQSGITADTFYTYIRDLVANRPIDGETYYKCNERQKLILQAIKRGKQMGKRDELKENNNDESCQQKKQEPQDSTTQSSKEASEPR